MNLDSGEALDSLSPACIEWCQSVGSNATTIYDVLSGPDARIMRAIQDGIDRTNKTAASNAQKVQKWTILPRDFTVITDELGKQSFENFTNFIIVCSFCNLIDISFYSLQLLMFIFVLLQAPQ